MKMMSTILYYLILFLLTLVSILPLRVHYLFSSILAFLLRRVFKYRTVEISANLARSFPNMKYGQLKKLVKEYYLYMSDIMVETIWAYTASRKQVAKHFRLDNVQLLNEIYSKGKSVVVMLGHQGNWELFTGMPNLRENYGLDMDNDRFVYIYKAMSSKLADRLIYRIRDKHKACSLVESNNIIRHILKERESASVCYFIADQSPGKSGKVVVNFLNQPTLMINGPEYVARKMGLPVLFFGVDKIARGQYVGTYSLICENGAETEEGYITRRFAERLQESIYKNQVSWLWSHKRWKANVKLEND